MAFGPWQQTIQERINALEVGGEFSLRELMADRWGDICADQREQAVGGDFSRAVRKGAITRVEYSHVRRSPRATMWRRI